MAEVASFPSDIIVDFSSLSLASAIWSLIELSAEIEDSLDFNWRLNTSPAYWEDVYNEICYRTFSTIYTQIR